MTMNTKPRPLHPTRERVRCPVCHEVSYSAAGVHPQCAMQQADSLRMQRVKRRAKVEQKATAGSDIRPWQKVCPKCRAVVHVRNKACCCGHAFRPSAGGRRA